MNAFLLVPLLTATNWALAQKPDSLPALVYRWESLRVQKEENRLRRQIMEGSTTSLAHFEVHASTLEPGQAPHAPHSHADEEELIIVKEGKVKIRIGNLEKELGAGSVAFAMPGEEHGIENAGNGQATYYILKYKGNRGMDMERAKRDGGSFMINWEGLATRPTGKGYRRDFFNRGTSQLGQFEMHTTALNADSVSHAPHTHVQEEIILVLRGQVEMHIDGSLHKASAGDVIFLPSRVPHALKSIGREQCEYFAFQWRN